MTRPARKLLLAALAAVYGIAVVGASAMHGSFGAKARAAAAAAHDEAPSLAASHDDCPVCHFQAQGQVVVAPDRQFCVDVVSIRPPGEPTAELPSPPDRPSSPRAPPAA